MDVKLAFLNLNFAASRCGELPELSKLRNILRDLLGNEFEACNVKIQPETLVKSELRTLSAGSIPDDDKLELIKEIARDFAAIRRLPKNYQQVYEIHEKQYEMKQDLDGPRLGKKPDPGYTTKQASDECSETNIMVDVWLRNSTQSMDQIQGENIVYQDGIKEKPQFQSYYDSEAAVLSLNSKGVRKRTLCSRGDIQAYQPLPQEPSKKISHKQMHLQKSTVDDTKLRIQTQASTDICLNYKGKTKQDVPYNRKRRLGHVYPKLPEYEDLEVTFKHPSARVGQ